MTSYLDYYRHNYENNLKELDISLKSEESISIARLSELLSIEENEIKLIMKKEKIDIINKKSVYLIMMNGTSRLCSLFRREIQRGCPVSYTRDDIAYIYNLNIDVVNNVCDFLKIKEATSLNLKLVLAHIYIKEQDRVSF